MILIADSGSTKTDWRLINQNNIQQFKTIGLNPYFHNSEKIFLELEKTFSSVSSEEISQVVFYGSGCGTENSKQVVQVGLQQKFDKAQIEVYDDMLGAARGACGKEEGIVCILGTGSNSCFYQYPQIVSSTPSNGIWLGDEGSAGYLGKQLIIAYLNEELPQGLVGKFEKRYEDRRTEILDHIYRKPKPNLYLAQYSRFLYHNLNHPYVARLVFDAFSAFFKKTVCTYENYRAKPVHSVGSVGFYYSNILRKAAENLDIYLKNILETPIAGLTLFHQELE